MLLLPISAAFADDPPPAAASDTVVGAVLREEGAYDPVRDKDDFGFPLYDDDFAQLNSWGRVWASGKLKKGDHWFLEARLQHHLLAGYAPTPDNPDHVGAQGWWDAGLGESGWDGKLGGPVSLRAGALIERWGRLFYLPVVDVLNAHDLRSGLLTPPEFLKVPEPMAVLSIASESVRAETVYIPFAIGDRVQVRDTNWSLVRQGFIDGALKDMKSWPEGENAALLTDAITALEGVIPGMDPSLRRGLDAAILQNEAPQAFLGNGEVAERLRFMGKNADLSLMGGWLRSTLPMITLNPEVVGWIQDETIPAGTDDISHVQDEILGNIATVEWPRTFVAGADTNALVGPFQLSAEGMWSSDKVVPLSYLRAVTRPSVGVGVGAQYIRGSNFVLTGEAKYTHIFDAPLDHQEAQALGEKDGYVLKTSDLLLMRFDQVQLAGALRWTILHNKITIQSGGLIDLTFLDYAAAGPALGWRVNDHVLLELGGVVMIGSTPPPSQLLPGDADHFGTMNYPGGPIDYFQTNDAITLAVSLIH